MMDKNIYAVEQTNHGHCYRWIFEKESLLKEGIDLSEDETWADFFPIGGSNSSSASIRKLNSEEEAKSFLLGDYNTDSDDPMLVEIAEGIVTIEVNDGCYGSITSRYVELFGIPEERLTVNNCFYVKAEKMIEKIKEKDSAGASGIDYENPFYGTSREMRFSELEELYEKFCGKTQGKKEIFDWMRERIKKASYNHADYGTDFAVNTDTATDIVDEAEAKWKEDCCEWEYNEVEEQFDTSCGVLLNPNESDREVTNFCCCCGKRIKIVEVK